MIDEVLAWLAELLPPEVRASRSLGVVQFRDAANELLMALDFEAIASDHADVARGTVVALHALLSAAQDLVVHERHEWWPVVDPGTTAKAALPFVELEDDRHVVAGFRSGDHTIVASARFDLRSAK